MACQRIVITRDRIGVSIEPLKRAYDAWVWEEDRPVPPGVLAEQVTGTEGLFCMLTDKIDQTLLSHSPRLRVVSQMAVGVDNIDIAACTAARIPVGHTPNVLTETTADTAFALLAAVTRRIPEGAAYVRQGLWKEWRPDLLLGGDLYGTTLGILGMGRIGSALARRAMGFSMRVTYCGNRKPEVERNSGAIHLTWSELLSSADHLVVAAPLTPATRHIIDRTALAAMKPTSTLVNIARGPLVDSDALADALETGVIGQAALDVTDPEPIPSDHRLLSLPNCLVIPHLGSASVRTRQAMATRAIENLIAGLAGERLPSCVNPEVLGRARSDPLS